ncbi:hypothetical protein [Ciceribacter thiooxidans]|uniref:Uncharacterized protein n=1 Tax=Ciceribacter thiooxidans TaxID=1969821 RepID=A0ABV7I6V1_9HYPH|nr:hypothetical protein [Ciceribacter thiooxidans]
MQNIDSATHTLNASAGAMKRRVFLAAAGTAALPAAAFGRAIAVSPQSPGLSSELATMIADYRATTKEREAINKRIGVLVEDEPSVMVSVSEVMTNPSDYYPRWREEKLYSQSALVKAFHHYSHPLILVNEAAGKRVIADGVRAEELMRERMSQQLLWAEKSGVSALEDRDGRLYEHQNGLRDAICKFPCRCIGDAIAKAHFAQSYLIDFHNEYSEELASIVRSMLPLSSVDEQVSSLRSMSEALNASPI